MTQSSPVQIWSATPTPLTADLTVDLASTERMVRDAIASAIHGLFLGGTCGEGPWLPDRERDRLVHTARQAAGDRLRIAVQVSDTSVPRILHNIRAARDAGADYAIVAPPLLFMNATADRITRHFLAAAEASLLPVGIYDLGAHRSVMIPADRLQEIYLHPNVRFIKDSSGLPARREAALAARAEKPSLQLFNGDEFRCLDYLQAGYDGMMFGGAVAVAPRLHRIAARFASGQLDEARAEESEMKRILYGIYGGMNISCWLSGLKYHLVCRGLFSSIASYLEYPLTPECRAFIESLSPPPVAGHAPLGS